MSATMDQFRLSEISPQKMSTKAKKKFTLLVKRAKHRKIEDRAKPIPQMRGSALWFLGLHFVLRKLPKGTPKIPESIVMIPKTKAILKSKKLKPFGHFKNDKCNTFEGPLVSHLWPCWQT